MGIPWNIKSGAANAGTFDFMIGEVPYRSGPPLHVHRVQRDIFYILGNVLAIQVEDEILDWSRVISPACRPASGTPFDNVRTGQPPVKAVNLMVPAGIDTEPRVRKAGHSGQPWLLRQGGPSAPDVFTPAEARELHPSG